MCARISTPLLLHYQPYLLLVLRNRKPGKTQGKERRIRTTRTVRSRVARGGKRDGCDRHDKRRRRGGVCVLAGWVERSEGGRGRCGSLGLERGWV